MCRHAHFVVSRHVHCALGNERNSCAARDKPPTPPTGHLFSLKPDLFTQPALELVGRGRCVKPDLSVHSPPPSGHERGSRVTATCRRPGSRPVSSVSVPLHTHTRAHIHTRDAYAGVTVGRYTNPAPAGEVPVRVSDTHKQGGAEARALR